MKYAEVRTSFILLAITFSSFILVGCSLPLVEIRPQVKVENVTVNFPENATSPFQVEDLNVTKPEAPDNLTICVVGLQSSVSDELFEGNFSYGNRTFSYSFQY